tara:strand:+ start:350 stop:1666 length:1317 start_codon:yes stop_codon:yes gene_type:complete
MNDNFIKRLYNFEKFDWIILLTLIGLILIKFLNYEHYPVHDEIVSVTLLSDIKTSLIKFQATNHYISTQIGNIIIGIFGVDLVKLRLISLISFFLIIVFFYKKTKNLTNTILLILFCLTADIIIEYYSLYRGYAISAFLFTYIYFLMIDEKNKNKNLKIIYLILSILIFHNQSNLFLIIPLLLVISYNFLNSKNKFSLYPYKIIFVYFCIPFFVILSVTSFIEGIKAQKLFLEIVNFNFFTQLSTKDIFSIFLSGFKDIFFNKFTNVSLFGNIGEFLNNIKNNIILFSIFILALIKSSYVIFFKKKPNNIDYVIFLFFITFLILNRNGPVRIYTGFITFFLIYILYDMNFIFLNKTKFALIIKFTLLALLIFKILNINFIKTKNLKKNYIFFANSIKNCNFPLNKKTSEFNKHMEYYVYLSECDIKPNINKFYKFYKY